MMIIRKFLGGSEIYPSNQRYNADCDCTQITPDGGTTWTDAPGIDPRTSDALKLPPFPSADPPCDAAASIVANMKAGLDGSFAQIGVVATGGTAVTGVLTLLEFLTGIGLLISLITDVVLAVITIGVGAVDEAFTTDVYDQLKCIFDCHAETDGTYTQSDFDAITAAIAAQFGDVSTVNIVSQGWLKFLGHVGLTNIASAKHIIGDCTDCACGWCYEWPDEAALLADGWTHAINTGSSDFWAADFTVEITKIRFSWSSDGIGESGDSAIAIWGAGDFSNRLQLATPLSGAANPYEWDGDESVIGVSFGLNAASGSGGAVSTSVLHLEGVGVHPDWTHGATC